MKRPPFTGDPAERLERLKRLRQLVVLRDIQTRFDVGATDPVAWASTRCGQTLWSKQRHILHALATRPRVAVPSCHSSGKSRGAAVAVAWWLSRFPPGEAFALTSAPTADQVRAQLWQELHKVHAAGKLPGRLNLTEWWYGDLLLGIGRKSRDQDPDALTGHHARHLLVVIDESSGFAEPLWEAVDTLTASGDAHVLAIGNPDHVGSAFHRRCVSPDWHTIPIAAWDTPNFTGEAVPQWLGEVLLSPDWVERKRRQWGQDSPLWLAKVEAVFPESTGDTVISWSAVLGAQARWAKLERMGHPRILGVDVARLGRDLTVIGLLDGHQWRTLKVMGLSRTTEVTAEVVHWASNFHVDQVRVDADGVGGGVVDELQDIQRSNPERLGGARILAMHAGGSPVDSDSYVNARAEWWFTAADALEDWVSIDPSDDDLAGQLTAARRKLGTGRNTGKLAVESKQDMARRGLPSPDRADALILALAPLHQPPPPPHAVSRNRDLDTSLGVPMQLTPARDLQF